MAVVGAKPTFGPAAAADSNDFKGLVQTTNLGVRSSNLFGRTISG